LTADPKAYSASDRETLASLTTAVGFDTTKIPPTEAAKYVEYARIQAIDAALRFSVGEGVTPTSSLGLRLTTNSSVEIWGEKDMKNFKCIDDGGTAKLEVVYMRLTV